MDLLSKQDMMKLLTGQDLLGAWVMKTPPQLSIMPAIEHKTYEEFIPFWITYWLSTNSCDWKSNKLCVV
jgi:hypothetical protein